MAKAKQQRLPGTEDNHLKELDDLATQYAEVRDERMALGRKEVNLKDDLLAKMKGLKKKTYSVDGISIDVVSEEETVKVKVSKPKDEEEENAE
jgi:hypothetical protein